MSSIFGKLFQISTFGESHGPAIGVVIDGCPPLLEITEEEIQIELNRRRPGQSNISTPRKENDIVRILSGVYEGKTTGTPIALFVENQDARSASYNNIKNLYRPSHADFTYQMKYGIRNPNGGGRASARETIARVAAGAIAKKLLAQKCGIEFSCYVESVGGIQMPQTECFYTLSEIEKTDIRCPDISFAEKMIAKIKEIQSQGDSIGGTIRCKIRSVPIGLGTPVFDRLEADLAKAMLSLPATKGFEIGSGFAGTLLTGSQHNDEMCAIDSKIGMKTNRSGGVQGGISNGEEINFRVAFKPTPTILKNQFTVDINGNECSFKGEGRHDPCVLPRAVPIVEAMSALVLVDHIMQNIAQNNFFNK